MRSVQYGDGGGALARGEMKTSVMNVDATCSETLRGPKSQLHNVTQEQLRCPLRKYIDQMSSRTNFFHLLMQSCFRGELESGG